MARVKELITSLDAGDATGLSPSQLRDLGVSDAQGARQKTTFNNDLLELISHGSRGRVQCPIFFLYAEVEAETTEKLKRLIDGKVTSGQVSELLNKHGFSIGHHSIQRHRRRLRGSGCRCAE